MYYCSPGGEEGDEGLQMREVVGIAVGAGIVVLLLLVCAILLICALIARGTTFTLNSDHIVLCPNNT